MIGSWFQRKFVRPVLSLLRQGIAPERIALSIALGIVLGVTPVLGSTALLCLLAAVLLRLNLPAIQLVNLCVYPLQLALLVPFIRAGERMFAAPPIQITVQEIAGLIRADVWNAIATLWTATMHALAAWLALGSLASLAIYALLTPLLRRLSQSLSVEPR